MQYIRVVGAGLAGCEAALQLASSGFKIKLWEMKPKKKTAAQKLDGLCELVCSNSFRSTKSTNAVGLIKDEMLLLNGFLIRLALKARVPAGDSLAVDREVFSRLVQEAIVNHPNIEIINEEVLRLWHDDVPTIIATGPLTSDALATEIRSFIGQDRLEFYDAIAPIVDAESIDMDYAFWQSRWHQDEEEGDFLNCPMDRATYEKFVAGLNTSTKAQAHHFEDAKFFEGCMPIEVLAERGVNTLRFGPLKPVGLRDKRSDKPPYAVLQLRKEDRYGQSFNLVGCQTRMTIKEQNAVFKLISALNKASFLRYGSVHRNTYVNGPKALDEYFRIKNASGRSCNTFLAGQLTGVEGYVESMATGMIVATIIRSLMKKEFVRKFPKETALGGLYGHVLGHHQNNPEDPYCPSNVTWAMIPPLDHKKRLGRAQRRTLLYDRAISSLKKFIDPKTMEKENSAAIMGA